MRARLGAVVNGRAIFWGTALVVLAALIGTGVLLGGAAPGPRIGVTTFLAVAGLTILAVGNAEWFLRKTTRPEDYQGTCPVGESCDACGAFNYKPRRDCRSCGGPVNRGTPAP